jgi:GDPmannose 4,6-dehydratase
MYACNGIAFNHESPRRGETFVTRKITRGLANISQGLEKCLFLGNLDALRDWGHAKDSVRMQWLMLQQDIAEDFVISTGEQLSVRDFVRLSAQELGISLEFKGIGLNERATISAIEGNNAIALNVGDVIVKVDKRYFRPAEVDSLIGDSTKAKLKLGWVPEISVGDMCAEMIQSDLSKAKQHVILKAHGYNVNITSD